MRGAAWPAIGAITLAALLSGCAAVQVTNPISSVTPSATGTPNSVATFGNYAFVSVQGAGLIVTYSLIAASQTPAAVYTTPCADPSGMVTTTMAGANVMAAVCFDTGTLLTLTIRADGSLQALGSVTGLASPYPGIALDGANVYVPLFGSATANGVVARVSIANPAAPAITASVTLASPAPGQVANASYLAAAGGFLYVAAGSESLPLFASSSIQVIDESTMSLVGSPLTMPHSPQQIAIAGSVAYVTTFDAETFSSIDISNPASPRPMETFLFAVPGCHALSVAVAASVAYVGCFEEGQILRFGVADPARMTQLTAIPGITAPQRMAVAGNSLLVTGATAGGPLYTINLGILSKL